MPILTLFEWNQLFFFLFFSMMRVGASKSLKLMQMFSNIVTYLEILKEVASW